MKKRIFIALAIVFTGACVFLFNLFYREAKTTAITKLNEQQRIHAKQAARGIEEFFGTWTRNLNSLSKMDEIIDTDAAGRRYMKLFYEANQEEIRSITRMDERGIILHNFPSSSSVGADISNQKHVRELVRDHKPAISDVFRAVEGFDAVALYVPVFRGSAFKGSIGILINFESLARRYLDVIKIGETGYAWVVSRDGRQLYNPMLGFTGESVFETVKDSPSFIAMGTDMLEGHEGAATYSYGRIGGGNAGQTREYAVYMPIHIGNTFWSIAVASDEQDVLSGLIAFRNRLASVVGAMFVCGMVFSTLGAKAWFMGEALRESRERLSLALDSSGMAAFDWDILKNTRTWDAAVHRLLGTKPETFTGAAEEFFRVMPPEDRSAVQEALSRAVKETGVYETEYRAVWPDGTIRHIAARGKVHRDSAGRAVRMTGLCWDITEDKKKERELHRLNRTLKALRDSSRAMTRAAQEAEYLEEVCRIVVEDCGHAMVWVGFAEEDEGRSVRPVAYAGFEEGYLRTLKVTWADTERGRGPTGTAIRTGKPSACRQMLTDAAFAPWREEAVKRGYASSLALPLIANGKTLGALTLYSRETDPFSEDEVRLLAQLAEDLAYGIAKFRTEDALKESEAKYRNLFAELEVMLKEIHHRVKNNLQVIASLVDIQTNSLDNPALRGLLQNVRDRVRSMALVHEKLYQSESLARVEFADYIRSLLSYLSRAHGSSETSVELRLDLQPVSLSVETAVPCGLILNELVTNAFKHAFCGRSRGELAAALRIGPDGRVCLRVSDNGAGLPAGMDWRQSRSLGLRLVHLLAGQLNATVEVEVRAGNGTDFLISFEQSQPEQSEERKNA
jgi:PAS domain S-box-containing protein